MKTKFANGKPTRLPFLALLVCSLFAQLSSAATLTGTVQAQGKTGAGVDSQDGKYDSRQFKFAERVDYSSLRDFIVYIEGPVVGKVAPPEKPVQVITKRVKQKGAMFDPHVLPVLVGTTVEWPNDDEILHNVFSYSDIKPFDLGLYKSPQIEKVTFDKVGRVDVFCSIHARMNCIVLVLENPYFAATNDKGRYSVPNVPPGTYKLKAWHERMPGQVREIIVPESGEVKTDFLLGIVNLPKP